MTGNDDKYAAHGFERFFMVAAMQQPGDPPLTEEQQKELQPHRRHPAHQMALKIAHKMAEKHRRPFVVLRSSTLAMPPSDEPADV